MQPVTIAKVGLNLTAEVEVFGYTYPGPTPREVLARVSLGDAVNPLSGVGGTYTVRVYVNNVLISPDSQVPVNPGLLAAMVVSRPVPLMGDDVISIRAVGLPQDVAVNTVTTLLDMTPAQAQDLVGSGAVVVDHNYGGVDNLTVRTPDGAGVGGATVLAYLAADYAAGNRTPPFVKGSATTDSLGHWSCPLMLDPGSYTLLVYKQGAVQSQTVNLAVN